MELDLIATSKPFLSLLNSLSATCAWVTGMLGIIGIPVSRISLNAIAFSLVGNFINEAK